MFGIQEFVLNLFASVETHNFEIVWLCVLLNEQEEYRRKLEENLSLDSEGRQFRMLVFRGSPKSAKKSIPFLDEMQQRDEAEALQEKTIKQFQRRPLPKVLNSGQKSCQLIPSCFCYFLREQTDPRVCTERVQGS